MNATTQPANTTDLATLRQQQLAPREAMLPAVAPGFGSLQSFELMQRAAKLLASSTLVPVAYRQQIQKTDRYGNVTETRDNPNALANSVVALNMSQRMGADPLMVMQNLYIVEGRPSWSSQWIIAAINGCGRFSPLRFDLKDLGPKEVEYEVSKWVDRQKVVSKLKTTVQNLECVAWAIEKETGARIDSPKVSIEMAVKEGWYGKSGSKWQTMPEVMLRYRTASFFGKLYAPELLMGLQSVEEAHDIIDMNPDGSVASITTETLRERAARPVEVVQPVQPEPVAETAPMQEADPETGEILTSSDDGGTAELPSYAAVADAIANASSATALDAARGLIESVPDEQQQAQLHQLAAQQHARIQAAQQRELAEAGGAETAQRPTPAPRARRERAAPTGGLDLE
jgi:hypothetical protein